MSATRAFLALESRAQLRRWRRDRALRFHRRAIIEVEQLSSTRRSTKDSG